MTSSTYDGAKINLVQLEPARFVVSFRRVKDRVKTKKPQGSLSDLAVQIVFYLFAYYMCIMPYKRPIVKAYYASADSKLCPQIGSQTRLSEKERSLVAVKQHFHLKNLGNFNAYYDRKENSEDFLSQILLFVFY